MWRQRETDRRERERYTEREILRERDRDTETQRERDRERERNWAWHGLLQPKSPPPGTHFLQCFTLNTFQMVPVTRGHAFKHISL